MLRLEVVRSEDYRKGRTGVIRKKLGLFWYKASGTISTLFMVPISRKEG